MIVLKRQIYLKIRKPCNFIRKKEPKQQNVVLRGLNLKISTNI